MKRQFKTVDQVWEAIDKGDKVYWIHEGYEVLVVSDPVPEKNMYSHRQGKMLRVTFTENYFGSRLDEKELNNLFIKGAKNEQT